MGNQEVRPKVSIIVVNFNGVHHLRTCLASLKKQNYPVTATEIIVVDNGSTDDSVQYIEKNFPDIVLVKNSCNEGFARPNNRAAELATGELLALINNDMVAKEDWLVELVATMERTGVHCVAGTILNWDGTKIDYAGGTIDRFGYPREVGHNLPVSELSRFSDEREVFYACGGALLIRKETFLAIGGFDEDFFLYFEDTDLSWRLWLLGYKIIISPKALTLHRHNATAKKIAGYKIKYHGERNSLYMLYKNYDNHNCWRYLAGALSVRVAKISELLRLDVLGYQLSPDFKQKKNNTLAKYRCFFRLLRKSGLVLMHLAAIATFVYNLPLMNKKKKLLQDRRVLSDEEIIKLMHHSDHHLIYDEYQGYFDNPLQKWDQF